MANYICSLQYAKSVALENKELRVAATAKIELLRRVVADAPVERLVPPRRFIREAGHRADLVASLPSGRRPLSLFAFFVLGSFQHCADDALRSFCVVFVLLRAFVSRARRPGMRGITSLSGRIGSAGRLGKCSLGLSVPVGLALSASLRPERAEKLTAGPEVASGQNRPVSVCPPSQYSAGHSTLVLSVLEYSQYSTSHP